MQGRLWQLEGQPMESLVSLVSRREDRHLPASRPEPFGDLVNHCLALRKPGQGARTAKQLRLDPHRLAQQLVGGLRQLVDRAELFGRLKGLCWGDGQDAAISMAVTHASPSSPGSSPGMHMEQAPAWAASRLALAVGSFESFLPPTYMLTRATMVVKPHFLLTARWLQAILTLEASIMPVKKVDGGYKYGDSGKLYTGPGAREKAVKQGRAIEISRHAGQKGATKPAKAGKRK